MAAFEAVEQEAGTRTARPKVKKRTAAGAPAWSLTIGERTSGSLRRGAKGLRIEIEDPTFSHWAEATAPDLMRELYDRWRIERDG